MAASIKTASAAAAAQQQVPGLSQNVFDHRFYSEVAAKLKEAAELYAKDIEVLFESFEQLRNSGRPGESILLHWGWKGSVGSGHAMLLEVTKQQYPQQQQNLQQQQHPQQQLFTVTVYNSGAGIEYHRRSKDQNTYRPTADQALVLPNIPANRLNRTFWQAVSHVWTKNEDAEQHFLYVGVLSLLSTAPLQTPAAFMGKQQGQYSTIRSLEVQPNGEEDFLEKQVSGTCTIGCIKAYLYRQFQLAAARSSTSVSPDRNAPHRCEYANLVLFLTQMSIDTLYEEVSTLMSLACLQRIMRRQCHIKVRVL